MLLGVFSFQCRNPSLQAGERSVRLSAMAAEQYDQKEHIRKRVGGSLASLHPFQRVAALQRNADRLLGRENWRNKDDGTIVRKIVGQAARQ